MLAKKSQIILDHARERTPFQVRVSSCWYLQGSKLPVPFFWQLCIGFPAMILESQPKYPACHPPFWRQYIKQWPDYPRRTFRRGPETRRVSNRDEERKHVQHPVKWHARLMNFTSPWGAFPRHGHHQVLFWASACVCVCVCQVFKHSASNAMTLLHGHASWCHVSTLCSLMMLSSSERESSHHGSFGKVETWKARASHFVWYMTVYAEWTKFLKHPTSGPNSSHQEDIRVWYSKYYVCVYIYVCVSFS